MAKENIERFLGNSINSNYDVGLKKVQCDKSWKNFETSFLNCSRNEISNILSRNLTADILISDLFSESKNLEVKGSYPEHYKNYVGLVGVAKIGKTELIKEIIRHYSNQFYFVFYLDLREIDYEKPINLYNLLLPEHYRWMRKIEYTNAVVEKMLLDYDKILFIMDHLDASKLEHKEKNGQSHYYREAIPSYFISNILCGKIFYESKKIIVSRPLQYYKLHKDFQPKFVANVIGLTQDKQKNICKKKGLQLRIPLLKSKQDIYSLCTVPLSFNAFIDYLENTNCCITLTNMFAVVFCSFLESLEQHSSNDLNKLSEFAYLQLTNDKSNKFFFDLKELQTNKVDEVCIDSFFATELCQKYQPALSKIASCKFRFSNLLVQEFFVALKLFQSDTSKLKSFFSLVSKNLSENRDNSLNYVVILFLFGLCNYESNDVIKSLLSRDDINISNIKSCLNEFHTKLRFH